MDPIDQLLQEVRQEFATEDQRERAQRLPQAQRFLRDLAPYSDEGYWFEQFARLYPSRLEEALDYLAGLAKTKNHPPKP